MQDSCAVVIVARNNLHLTKKTLASVLNQDVMVDVIAVNNSSTDGTAQYLQTKPVTVINTGEQWSLSKCWNTALKALWKAGWNKALVLNNDLEISPPTARLLTAHGGEFVTCVSVNSPDQFTLPDSSIVQDELIQIMRTKERPHPDFSAFMIRKSVTDKIGWFNEDYWPAYCEDAEWHVRMHRAGIRAVCIDIPFLHHGASTLKSADIGEQARIKRGADDNRKRFKARYGCVPGTPEYESLFA